MNTIFLRTVLVIAMMAAGVLTIRAQNDGDQKKNKPGVETSTETTSRQDITIESKSFEIFRVDDSEEDNDIKRSFIVHLEATYNRTKKEITVKFLNNDKPGEFVIGDNLNLNTFRYKMAQHLVNYPTAKNANFFQEYSIQQVYLWLYSLVTYDDAEEIGTLNFRPALEVMDRKADNTSYRENMMTQAIFDMQNAIGKRNTSAAKIETVISRLLDTFKVRSAIDPTASTTADALKIIEEKKKQTESEIEKLIQGIQNRSITISKENIIEHLKEIDKTLISFVDTVQLTSLITGYKNVVEKIETEKIALKNRSIYPVSKISILFERGHIERIQVWVEKRGNVTHIFENIYAIGFTSISNYKAFETIRLYNRKDNFSNEYIFLGDVIASYDNLLQLYTRDYSPADTACNNINPQNTPNLTLRKERNIRLFDSRIYTDLVGFAEETPNGLVQVEVGRRFNINTKRTQVGSSRSDIALFMYAYLTGTLSKIENKDRVLPLRNEGVLQNNTIISPSYATNLDLRRYENASVQFDLNVFLFDLPDKKFTFYLDLGMRYGHVRVQDTIRKVENGKIFDRVPGDAFGANTFTYYPKLTLELFSERRVGLMAYYQLNRTTLMSNNRFVQVLSDTKSDLKAISLDKRARWSHMLELQARVETNRSGNGNIFARGRFFWQQGDANNFFPQIQLGYTYNILFRK